MVNTILAGAGGNWFKVSVTSKVNLTVKIWIHFNLHQLKNSSLKIVWQNFGF